MKQHDTIPARPYYSQIWRPEEKNKQKKKPRRETK